MSRLRVLLACEMSGRVRDEFARRGWEAWSADILPSETPCSSVHFPNRAPVPGGLHDDLSSHHYQGDVRDLFSDVHLVNAQRLADWEATPGMTGLWDLIIAFPPCTDISLAGARWFKEKRADGRQQAGADFFMEMIRAPSPHVAVENPRNIMFTQYRKPGQVVQPWEFGDPFRKNTCLWLKGLPKLIPAYTEPEVLATVVSSDTKGYRLHRVTTGGGSGRTDKGITQPAHDFNGRQHYEDSEGRKNRAKVRSRTFPGIAAAMASQWGSYIENLETP